MSRESHGKCIQKTGSGCVFNSEAEAREEANRLSARSRYVVRFSPYFCRHCGKFHVGKPYNFEKGIAAKAKRLSDSVPLEKVLVCRNRKCAYQQPANAVICHKCGGTLKETDGFVVGEIAH